jgi:hypothetical protein
MCTSSNPIQLFSSMHIKPFWCKMMKMEEQEESVTRESEKICLYGEIFLGKIHFIP